MFQQLAMALIGFNFHYLIIDKLFELNKEEFDDNNQVKLFKIAIFTICMGISYLLVEARNQKTQNEINFNKEQQKAQKSELPKEQSQKQVQEQVHEKVQEQVQKQVQEQEIQKILRKYEPYNKKIKDFQDYQIYLNDFLLKNYAEQKGNVCGSTSVACCVNYLLKIEKKDQQRVKTSDVQEIYFHIFEDKLQKAEKVLQKYTKDIYQELIGLADDELIDMSQKKEQFKNLAIQKIEQQECLENLKEQSLQRDMIIEHFRSYCIAKFNLNRIFNGKRCTTWPIGNDLISLCAKTIAQIKGINLKVNKFMGNEQCLKILSSQDTQEQIEEQWLSLIDIIKDQDQILLYHLDSHYTVIYGFRQVLTSRYGQRPKSWVDFQYNWEFFSQKKNKTIKKRSVRQCLINWFGYKILSMSVTKKNSKFVDKDKSEIEKLTIKYQQKNQFINNEMTEREISEGRNDCSDIEA